MGNAQETTPTFTRSWQSRDPKCWAFCPSTPKIQCFQLGFGCDSPSSANCISAGTVLEQLWEPPEPPEGLTLWPEPPEPLQNLNFKFEIAGKDSCLETYFALFSTSFHPN
jgi:hypothetical protein